MSIKNIVNDNGQPNTIMTFGRGSLMFVPCGRKDEQRQYNLAIASVEEGEIGMYDEVDREVPDHYEPGTEMTHTDPHYPVQMVFESRQAITNLIEQLQSMERTWDDQPDHIDTQEDTSGR